LLRYFLIYKLKMTIDFKQLTLVKEVLRKNTKILIQNYLNETQILLLEIDVARASDNDIAIIDLMYKLKISSAQTAAFSIMKQAILIENFLKNHTKNIAALHNQSRLDNMISTLRAHYASYQVEIFHHL